MAKSALRRRRGTRSKSKGCGCFGGEQHPVLQTLFVSMLLIALGLIGGLFLGLSSLSSSSDSGSATSNNNNNSNPLEKLSNLRAGAGAARGNPPAKKDASLITGSAAAANPSQFEGMNKLDVPVTLAGGVDVTDKSRPERKQAFLDHVPIVGTKGPFPYYPNGAALVEETHDFSGFTAPGPTRFEEWKHGDSPYTFQKGESDDLARSRRFHIKKGMQFAWGGYEKYAFGMDEVKPQTMSGDNGWGGFGTTLVDSLDTLWLMGMKEEFQRARDWVASSLQNDRNRMVSVFETTIRSLGGLLSAYDMSGDEIFLEKAHDLGNRLFQAVDKNDLGIPYGQVNLHTGDVHDISWVGSNAMTAEFGTIQIEFRMLGRLTGHAPFKEKTEHVFQLMKEMNPKNGLYPYFVRNQGNKLQFANDKLTFGAMSDSFYEYMLKIWLQGGKSEPLYREMYDDAIQGMHDELLQVSSPTGLVFIADKNGGRLDEKMDHLVCFMGGLLALGAYTDPLGLDSERAQRDLKTAKVGCPMVCCVLCV